MAAAIIIFLLGSVALPDIMYSAAVKVQTVTASRRDVQITKNVTGNRNDRLHNRENVCKNGRLS